LPAQILHDEQLRLSVCERVLADRLGRRSSLLPSTALMGAARVVFAVSESNPLLLAPASAGTASRPTNDNTTFGGVGQAILAQTNPAVRGGCRGRARHTRPSAASSEPGVIGAQVLPSAHPLPPNR
jgi:hypothetical protein